MHGLTWKLGVVGLAAVTTAAVLPGGHASAAPERKGPTTDYVVLYRDTAHAKSARAAIKAAGGKVLEENSAIGTALVRTKNLDFSTAVRRGGAVFGAAHNRPIGHVPPPTSARELAERLSPADRAEALRRIRSGDLKINTHRAAAARRAVVGDPKPVAPDPLAPRQWDMAMIGATAQQSYATDPGDPRVKVGVIDTGIDGSHPDIAPNFDAADSRNFTTDIPDADGPCEVQSCKDPADVDDNGHGTHVASTIAAPLNGMGIAGVAPGVTLVDVRAGQDSGFFFLQPVVDALTYAGDAGLNVVNMSFFVDPWVYNCSNNPKDDASAQSEQRTVIAAVQKAVFYAHDKGVTTIASMGNDGVDLGTVKADAASPDYPAGKAYPRTLSQDCMTVPAETDNVLAITALGPSGRLAYYSNYGGTHADFAAPGGDAFDTPDHKVDPTAQILAAYPEHIGRANGDIDASGNPTSPFVVKDCSNHVCGYYQYLQGTSMAAPHATGVAALAISRLGTPNGDTITMNPRLVQYAMAVGAERKDCPDPAAYPYTIDGTDGPKSFTHKCDQQLSTNSFYGQGVVSASGVAALPSLTGLSGPAPSRPNRPAPAPTPSAPPTPAPAPTPSGAPTDNPPTDAPPTDAPPADNPPADNPSTPPSGDTPPTPDGSASPPPGDTQPPSPDTPPTADPGDGTAPPPGNPILVR
ncbi:MAG TPA: S8 family serine peptidase [Sporichthyaceae bacterium]|nr:S8 family serine peptidase [Sporichthyaceae bacterium]